MMARLFSGLLATALVLSLSALVPQEVDASGCRGVVYQQAAPYVAPYVAPAIYAAPYALLQVGTDYSRPDNGDTIVRERLLLLERQNDFLFRKYDEAIRRNGGNGGGDPPTFAQPQQQPTSFQPQAQPQQPVMPRANGNGHAAPSSAGNTSGGGLKQFCAACHTGKISKAGLVIFNDDGSLAELKDEQVGKIIFRMNYPKTAPDYAKVIMPPMNAALRPGADEVVGMTGSILLKQP